MHPGWGQRGFQRLSTLIQKLSALTTTDQRCFSSDLALYITWKSLNSADSALISAGNSNFQSSKISAVSALISSDTAVFRRYRITLFNSIFTLFRNISKYLNFEASKSRSQPNRWKELINKNLVVQSFHRPNI